MRDYFDKENGIVWIDYFSTEPTKQPETMMQYLRARVGRKTMPKPPAPRTDVPETLDILKEFDSWSSSPKGQGIRDYVTLSPESKKGMGSYFFNKYLSPSRPKTPEDEYKSFHLLTAFRANRDGEVVNTSPLGTVLLSHENYEVTYKDYLEYIVVNPDILNKGIGTEMLESMATNLPFFTRDKDSVSLATYIRKNNTASKKLFTNMGFSLYEQPYIEGLTDHICNSNYASYVNNNFAKVKAKRREHKSM